ncbi:pyridoxamine 5'-phosphate oxidase [Rhizodiscina lignyota]|uniref:pyridoxal 5'-phosphate synthase n=1 Tax=Rhizodiscina lignyota TaxID=1504668 RepID=A0A9P4IPF9_9PEZI|nr:pyridoxamine 5'-phosphate oxidase [Rhizodiscina lignyota]
MSTTTPASGTKEKLIFAPGGPAEQFNIASLDIPQLERNPLVQFNAWFAEAHSAGVYHPETVNFATAELPSGRVSARTLYMKELDERGFVMYSNWDTSRKAADLNSNPQAALTFFWRELERQVRVEGRTERISREESQVYYDTRIRGSRIGAWASRQSAVLKDRQELEGRVKEVEEKFEGQDKFPVPDFWGGVRVVPDMIEFWQGRQSRLHDRFRYEKDEGAEGGWRIERLSP